MKFEQLFKKRSNFEKCPLDHKTLIFLYDKTFEGDLEFHDHFDRDSTGDGDFEPYCPECDRLLKPPSKYK
jgi:hypothetical protein